MNPENMIIVIVGCFLMATSGKYLLKKTAETNLPLLIWSIFLISFLGGALFSVANIVQAYMNYDELLAPLFGTASLYATWFIVDVLRRYRRTDHYILQWAKRRVEELCAINDSIQWQVVRERISQLGLQTIPELMQQRDKLRKALDSNQRRMNQFFSINQSSSTEAFDSFYKAEKRFQAQLEQTEQDLLNARTMLLQLEDPLLQADLERSQTELGAAMSQIHLLNQQIAHTTAAVLEADQEIRELSAPQQGVRAASSVKTRN